MHFSHESRTSGVGGKEAEWLCILLFFNYNASVRGVNPPAKFCGGAFLLSAAGARLLRASAIHFVETYNLTRVLMSVANKYSDDRRRGPCRTGARGPGPSGTALAVARGEALLAKYLGGQLGGRGLRRLKTGGEGADVPPGAGRCIERVLQTRSRAAILRSLCDIAPR